MAKTFTFIVSGQQQPAGAAATRGGAPTDTRPALPRGRLKQSVRLGAQRGAASEVRVVAESDRDVVVLRIAGGPALFLRPDSAFDLLNAQLKPAGKRGARESDDGLLAGSEVRVPPQLQWRGLAKAPTARSGPGDGLPGVVLDGIDILTDAAAGLTADLVVRKVDDQVNEGVYLLQRGDLPKLKDSGAAPVKLITTSQDQPALVLVHGTFSNTSGTFAKLWKEHPQQVAALFDHYQDRVYGLDHRTLGASPIANALTLAKALPKDARVHLLTHSRGGLVAEVLVRACNSLDIAADLKFFAGRGYEQHRQDLTSLHELLTKNRIQVEQVVRVACPARGTLLASRRLDAYLSIFKWSLELGGVPVLPAIVDFIAEVATRRADPAKIPGLSAQIPDSPLVTWLYSAPDPIPGELRVVAGDLQGDSVVSWLKALVADSFFWTDNDLVVQTRSMYGGVPRDKGATFVLDKGGKVSHFSYFSNETTAVAIVNALIDGDTRKYQPIGPKSWAGESSSGTRAKVAGDTSPASDKPAVFMLPGILGSNLDVDGKRIWLGPRIVFGLKQLAFSPTGDDVRPDGPLGLYDDLSAFLSETHEVIEFGYDWRRPLEDEARRLADDVQKALAAREHNGLPVRLVAHSMGGLLARTMLLERPEAWKQMMSRTGARILMLGTPNGGSWAPMQVLSGDDAFGNLLVTVGAPFQAYDARTLMASFPGFIQMQAGLQDANPGLASAATWEKLAADDLASVDSVSGWHDMEFQHKQSRWGVPPQDVLDQAVALRRRLDAQRDSTLATYADRILLVVGQSEFTPDGYEFEGREGLVYLNTQSGGDGRVTWASARLPGVETWKVDCEHGKLPEEKGAYGAYLELLEKGTTGSLAPLQEGAAARGSAAAAGLVPAHVRSRPARDGSSGRPPTIDRDLLAPSHRDAKESQRDQDRGTALHITVTNGDLKFVRQPLVLGHYRSVRLTGTEWVMNELIGQSMSAKLKAGSYPDAPGTNQVFTNRSTDGDYPGRIPRPEAVIVAGLGGEGELRALELVQTVRQAVIEWAQRESEKPSGGTSTFELACTLIGSGGSGISAGQSAQLIAQGVREANERLAEINWPIVGHLHLIELYLDRATEAWRSLQVQADSTPSKFVVTNTVVLAKGAMRRPLESGYRGADYDLISAISDRDGTGNEVIAYTLDTRRARTEIRAQATQGSLLRRLVATASNDRSTDDQIGRTLFRLLVPVEMEMFLGDSTDMVIELDPGTAGIPWELLDANVPGSGDNRPWAIRSKLIRKLRLGDFRRQVKDASKEESILVIGEPMCDTTTYPRLPGARAEANMIVKRLTAPGALRADRVTPLISPDDEELPGPDARTVINTIMARDWRIVHISGHGEPPAKIGPEPRTCDDPEQTDGDPRGVVLSDCSFLGPREIENMRVVPELVFVNCCHLAARNTGQLLQKYDRARFAATVAEKLIAIGVRCVIAAGWAVDDATASTFAATFYDEMLRGRRFLDAVAEAREAAHALGGNTWAAYQCYGDPDWVFEREGADAQSPYRPLSESYRGIGSSVALENALETLRVESKYQGKTGEEQRVRLRYLDDQFGSRWGSIGSVATAFAQAWDALGDHAAAIGWYERAVAAQDGTAATWAIEQLANLRVRKAWNDVLLVASDDRKTVRATMIANARGQIDAGIALLEKLIAIQPSMERLGMLGSAYKRLAMVLDAAGKPSSQAIAEMKSRYQQAEVAGRNAGLSSVFHPMLNLVAAELVSRGRTRKPLDPDRIAEIRQVLDLQMRDDPEFWAAAGQIELTMYEALASPEGLRSRLKQIIAEYQDLNTRVKAKSMWASVYDQAGFVLPRCIPKAAKTEMQAGARLLKLLKSFA